MLAKIKHVVKKIRGEKIVFDLMWWKIHVLIIATTYSTYYNVYLFYIPLLRVRKGEGRLHINLLLLVWLFKLLAAPFVRWRFSRCKDQTILSFSGINIYSRNIRYAYKFPTAQFSDMKRLHQ